MLHVLVICVIAFVAMVASNILSTALTQASARNRANLSGILDTLCWGVSLTTTFISLDALNGNNLALKAAVILSVSAANYIGSVLGVKVGQKYIKGVLDRSEAKREQG